VNFASNKSLRRAGAMLLVASALGLAGSVQPAAAENFFEALFGGFQRRAPELPPQSSAYAEPYAGPGRIAGETGGSFGHGTVFCVRTCDGRYFPMQRHAGQSPAEVCNSFCPTAKTMVFSGSKIDYAVAPNGTRYADLDNAFVYRDKTVSNCTCNGREGGLANVDTGTDPTLRPGDIVATNDGFETFRGKGNAKTAEFSPINPSSSELARKLSESKIRPAPPAQEITPIAQDDTPPIRGRRQQAAR
jgi:hypothetical protein